MLTHGKVILFYPPYDGPPLGAPLCLLALAASLREANFDVVMIDAAIEPDYLTRIECESVDALCIGISVLTGPMIRGAIEVATAVKSYTPWLPVIFGGWHPSLLPDQTLSETFVEMIDLVTRYRTEEVALLDSNFPVQLPRALEIARGILASGVKFNWTFQASTDFLCRMSEEDVRLLGASGVSHMGFGTESTSESVLKLMNKRHQHVDEMYETARKAQLGGIRVTFNLIFGYPGETEADRIITFQTMSDIGRQFSNVSFSPNIFTPYPGIPIWPQLREMGVPEPKSLREWMDMPLGANMLPWLKGRELARLQRMLNYFLLNNQIDRRQKNHSWLRLTVRFIVQTPIRWRLRSSRYSFPWELWLSNLSERIILRRSLVTGQELPKEPANAC